MTITSFYDNFYFYIICYFTMYNRIYNLKKSKVLNIDLYTYLTL